MISCIYKIESISTGRLYIGSALHFSKRKNLHLWNLRRNAHHAKILQRHYNKYGEADLLFNIIKISHPSNLIEDEQYFIDTLSPYFNSVKFAGHTTGWKHSKQTKEKLSIMFKGRIMSEDAKEKISKATKGLKKSSETRKKISQGLIGLKKSKSHCLNLSKALSGREIPFERVTRQSLTSAIYLIEQYSLAGDYIQCFESSHIASSSLNIPKKPIQRVCRGEQNSTNGFKFKYVLKNDNRRSN